MSTSINPEQKGVIAGAAIAIAGLLLLFVPGLAGLDGFDGGYALGMVGVLLILLGGITLAFMLPRSRVVGRMLSGEDLLVHWVYDEASREQQVSRDRGEQLRANGRLLLIVLGWWVLWVAVFLVIGHSEGNGDEMSLFVAIMAGVLLLVTAAGFGFPYLRAWRARKATPEAYIGRGGLLANGTFHPWKRPWSALDRVVLEDDRGVERMVFHLRSLTGPGWLHWVPYTVEVPVPPGERARAEQVVSELSAPGTSTI